MELVFLYHRGGFFFVLFVFKKVPKTSVLQTLTHLILCVEPYQSGVFTEAVPTDSSSETETESEAAFLTCLKGRQRASVGRSRGLLDKLDNQLQAQVQDCSEMCPAPRQTPCLGGCG